MAQIIGNQFGGLIPFFHLDSNGNVTSELIPGGEFRIYNEVIALQEFPDLRYGFKVVYNNVPLVRVDIPNRAIKENEYRVDEKRGFLYFHPSMSGKNVAISDYYGRGGWLMSADRIILMEDGVVDLNKTLENFMKQIRTYEYKGVWASNEKYLSNNQVIYNGSTYLAKGDVPIGTVPTNTTYWRVFGAGLGDSGTYNNTKAYFARDVVEYDNSVYVCIKATNPGTLPTNATYWRRMISVKSIYTEWAALKAEINEDIEDALLATADAVSNATSAAISANQAAGEARQEATAADSAAANARQATTAANEAIVLMENYAFIGAWNGTTQYKKNNTVVQDGTGYIALTDNVNMSPKDSPTQWKIFAQGMSPRGTFVSGTKYYPGDVVANPEKTTAYVCLVVNTNIPLTNPQYFAPIIDVQPIIDAALGGGVVSVNGRWGVVTLDKSDVELSNVDNTADSTKSVLSATKLTTPRTINGIPFDGTQNISIGGGDVLRFVYECTGVDDDLAIETIINNFFNNSDDMSMNLVITGTFVPRVAPPDVGGGLNTCLYANSTNARGAVVNIDWSDCNIDKSKFITMAVNYLVFFMANGNCNINMTGLRLIWASIHSMDGQLLDITGGRVAMINCNISAFKLFDIKNGGKLTFSGGVVSMNWQPGSAGDTVVNWIGCEIPGAGIDGGHGTLNFLRCDISAPIEVTNGGVIHLIGCNLANLDVQNRIIFVDSCTINGTVNARQGAKLYINNSYLWRTLVISNPGAQLYAMVKISGGRIEAPSSVPCVQITGSGYECLDITNCTMRSTNDNAILVSAANADNRINLTNCRVRGKILDINQTASVSTVKWNVVGCDFQTGIKINNVTSLSGTTNAYLYMPAYSNRMSTTIS